MTPCAAHISGPAFSDAKSALAGPGLSTDICRIPAQRARRIAELIAAQQVIGLLQGGWVGPRALGDRSIIGDAFAKMQSTMNLKIKYRESFRPFAPTCLEERVGDFFEAWTSRRPPYPW